MKVSKTVLLVTATWIVSLGGAYYLGSRQTTPTVSTAEVVTAGEVVEVIEREIESYTPPPTDSKSQPTEITQVTREKVTRLTTGVKQERKSEETHSVPAPKSQYSLSIDYLPSLTELPSLRHTRIEVGMRLGETPFWATTAFDLKHRQVTLGLRLEF